MKWDFIDSVEFEGAPKEGHLEKIEKAVLKLIEKIKDKIVE